MDLVTFGTAVVKECVEKEDNKNSTKENVCLEEFVGVTTSETTDSEKSPQSIAEIETEKESEIVSCATEHVQTSTTCGETSSCAENITAVVRREEFGNDAGKDTSCQEAYYLKESYREAETKLEIYGSSGTDKITTVAKPESETEEDNSSLSGREVCGGE